MKVKPLINWNHKTKKLTGHYTPEAIEAMITKLVESNSIGVSKDGSFELSEADSHQFTLSIARLLKLRPRTIKEVPGPIRKWCLRLLRIYIHKELYEAWSKKVISTRFAMDLADYVYMFRYRDLYNKAIEGKLNNTDFRRIKKERKK